MVYVALLRGINVGGKNRVNMKELKSTFEDEGMTQVKTYINSGNVIFLSTLRSKSQLTSVLEAAIAKRCGFHVDVLVRDRKSMRAIVEAMPIGWTNDNAMRCDVIYLWADVARPSVLKKLPIRPEVEDVRYAAGAIIWRIDRRNVTKSGLAKIIGTDLYKKMTIRNCNTARKLVALMDE